MKWPGSREDTWLIVEELGSQAQRGICEITCLVKHNKLYRLEGSCQFLHTSVKVV